MPGAGSTSGNVDRRDRVVVLGAGAAERLGIARLDQRPAVFIGDEAFTVIGIIGDMAREQDLDDAVLFPSGMAARPVRSRRTDARS